MLYNNELQSDNSQLQKNENVSNKFDTILQKLPIIYIYLLIFISIVSSICIVRYAYNVRILINPQYERLDNSLNMIIAILYTIFQCYITYILYKSRNIKCNNFVIIMITENIIIFLIMIIIFIHRNYNLLYANIIQGEKIIIINNVNNLTRQDKVCNMYNGMCNIVILHWEILFIIIFYICLIVLYIKKKI